MDNYTNNLPLGIMIHKYELRGVLGEGGFGITYHAYDTQLDRDVAIKEFYPIEIVNRADDKMTVVPRNDDLVNDFNHFCMRFLEEAKTLAQFHEPNIVSVLDHIEMNGTAYMVMPFEKGETLDNYLHRHKRLSEDQLFHVFMPIMDGLRAVHAKGLLHRDVKPANIYLRDDGPPLLIDFGAARQVSGSNKTMTAMVSIGYAPFEQYSSSSSVQLTEATDIYAIGGTMYRCMTGEAPTEAIARFQAVTNDEKDSLIPLETACKAGEYKPEILKVVTKCLALQARDRYQSIQELQRDLIQARGDSTEIKTEIENKNNKSKTKTKIKSKNSKAHNKKNLLWVSTIFSSVVVVALFFIFDFGDKFGDGGNQLAGETDAAEIVVASRDEITDEDEVTISDEDTTKADTTNINTLSPQAIYNNVCAVCHDKGIAGAPKLGDVAAWQPRLSRGRVTLYENTISGINGMPARGGVSELEDNKLIDVVDYMLEKVAAEYALTIVSIPAGCKISIINIKPKYKAGMKLKPGRYHLRVSKAGYVTYDEWFTILDHDVIKTVTLKRDEVKETVSQRCYDATKKSDSSDKYIIQQCKPAAEAGDIVSQRNLAYAYVGDNKFKSAFKWFKKAADKGDKEAANALSLFYYYGQGVKQDYKSAYRWAKIGAKAKFSISQFIIGEIHYHGYGGVTKNQKKALEWHTLAAKQGYTDSEFRVGSIYYYGAKGVPVNYTKAREWLEKAIKDSHPKANYILGLMYIEGHGVKENFLKGKRYMTTASDLGDKEAKEYLKIK